MFPTENPFRETGAIAPEALLDMRIIWQKPSMCYDFARNNASLPATEETEGIKKLP
jgi:hypothetical protein